MKNVMSEIKSPFVRFNLTKTGKIILVFIYSETKKIRVAVANLNDLRNIQKQIRDVVRDIEDEQYYDALDEIADESRKKMAKARK